MGYIDEDGCFDLDNPDFADDYVFDYILQNLYPKGVEVTPEFADLYGSWEIKLFSFEKLLPTINFQLRNLNL